MKKQALALGMLLGGLFALSIGTRAARPSLAPPPAPEALVVGTFDSRGVVMAHVRSKAFQDYLRAQQADIGDAIERAREAGDLALVKELNALGPAMQRRIHEQGFGSAPIDELMASLADRLPEVASAAGVDLIVSKWQLAYLAEGARTVDVTDALLALFEPTPDTLEGIHELMKQDPVPLEDLKDDH
jgi:hypothetical protein